MAPQEEEKETESKSGMTPNDVEFLVMCLKNTNGGAISVSLVILSTVCYCVLLSY
jgi:hypothetical protein